MFSYFSFAKSFDYNHLKEFSPGMGISKAWYHKENKKIMINLFKRTSKKVINKKSFELDQYIKGLIESKKSINSIIGLKNWKIKKYSLVKLEEQKYKDHLIIQLEGTYSRNKKEIVEFTEWHIYKHDKYIQFQMIQNQDSIIHMNSDWIKDGFTYLFKERVND